MQCDPHLFKNSSFKINNSIIHKMARKFVYCLTFGDKFHRNPLILKKILIYVILFKKQFDDKIFETYITQIY